ncbi:MAG: hypothetical protein U0637_09275 [Phycisphaerales bacterium]
MTQSLRTLMTDLIDYAGLFPPAKLDMARAVEAYNRCRVGEYEWMLGRFICPLGRLREFTNQASVLLPGTAGTSGYREMADAGDPWRLSVLVDLAPDPESATPAFESALETIDAFNAHHAREENGLASIDMIEMKVSNPSLIDTLLDRMPEDIYPFFEFPVTTDCRGLIASLSGSAAGAKIRTGGVVGDAFPTAAEVAAFLHACHAAGVPFKATAGLHHAVRGSYRLTYEPDSACHNMLGFLNVFVSAALLCAKGVDTHATRSILHEEDPASFRFSDTVLGWKNFLIENAQLAKARETFALSYGSCSFDEPVDDLRRLSLL